MVLKNVGINSTFEQQRVVINQIAVDVESLLTGSSGISSYANSAGISSNSDKLGNQLPSYYLNYSNLTGKPTNISQFANDSGYITDSYFTDRGGINLSPAGVVTAFGYYGNGSTLTGVVTSLVAGNNITVSSSSGQVIVSSTASGDNNYWTINGSGISTTANLGVGTTLPSTKLEVVGQSTFDGNVEFKAGAYFGDGDILHFGNSQDLQIQHNGTTNVIDGSLKDLYLNTHNTQINVNGTETAARFLSNNAVELYYDNTLKFTTSGVGVTVLGTVDAQYFVGDGSQLTNLPGGGGGGESYWTQTDVGIHTLSNVGIGTTNATSVLTVQGSGRFNSSYLDVYNTSGTAGQFAYLRLAGSKLVGFDGTYFNIDANVDYLNIKSDSGVRIGDDSTMFSGQVYANFYPNVLEFYAGGSEKLTVNSNGINVSGAVTATSFTGSAAGLTNIPSGQLTGALPAIDGSALTGIVATGSGVVIQDDGSSVGTAATINFGANIDVIFADGVATVSSTATGGGSIAGIDTTGTSEFNQIVASGIVTASRFESTSAGTPTIDSPNNLNINALNVGISTDLSVGRDLTVNGNVNAVGVVTATSFKTNSTVGDGSDVGFAIKYYITANGFTSYRFAGPGVVNTIDNPTLYLHRGFTYIFENSTTTSHPFAIRYTSGGTGYGSTYLSGPQTGTQIFTVPFDAPSSLVYQCTIHGGMVGTLAIVS